MAIKIELGQRYEVLLHEKRFAGRVSALPTKTTGAKVRLEATGCTFEIPESDFLAALPSREAVAGAIAQTAGEALGRSPLEKGTGKLAAAIAEPDALVRARAERIAINHLPETSPYSSIRALTDEIAEAIEQGCSTCTTRERTIAAAAMDWFLGKIENRELETRIRNA